MLYFIDTGNVIYRCGDDLSGVTAIPSDPLADIGLLDFLVDPLATEEKRSISLDRNRTR